MIENMDYEHIPLLIAKHLTGTLSDEEQKLLDDWRRQSAANEAAFLRLTDYERLTMEHKRHELTDVERPLTEMNHRLGINRKKPMTMRWLVAAAISLLIIGGAVAMWNSRQIQSSEQPQTAMTEIHPGHMQATLTRSNGEVVELTTEDGISQLQPIAEKRSQAAETTAPLNNLSTPRGGEFKVTLADGTEVWLNAQTTLRYPETFNGNDRRVEVSGEAYFKVAHDAEHPFYVVSGGQEVRVYGTEFNVNGYSDDLDIRTTLVKGSISLRPIDGNGSELMLSPGSQAIYDKQEARAHVRQVDTDMVTSWRNGTFVFEDQTMEQIMRTLSRWYDFEYEFADRHVAMTEFMGSIPRYGSFAEVAQIFEKMGGITLRQQNGKIIISEK